jgi:Branched-chain amino acid ATP-binding cassette transporter
VKDEIMNLGKFGPAADARNNPAVIEAYLG